MKTYKIYIMMFSVVAFSSCNKEMTKGLEDVEVSVAPGENVAVDGMVVTVNRGEPVKFDISGEPDFVTFYSGEQGHQYAFRDRYETELDDVISSTLKFNVYVGSATTNNTLDVYYAYTDEAIGQQGFPGLSKSDFYADSTLVDDFEYWLPMVDKTEFDGSKLADNVVNAKKIEFDVKKFVGKNLVIAIAYNQDRQKNLTGTVQPKYFFDTMCIENELRSDTTTVQYAGNFVFTPLNFNHDIAYPDRYTDDVKKYLPDDMEYGTVTANVPGMWNMSSVASGGFYIHSTAKEYDWKTAWLVSDPINILACNPDKGESIKNLSQDITSYTHTYKKPGTYKATFVLNNVNYKNDANKIITVVVNVK